MYYAHARTTCTCEHTHMHSCGKTWQERPYPHPPLGSSACFPATETGGPRMNGWFQAGRRKGQSGPEHLMSREGFIPGGVRPNSRETEPQKHRQLKLGMRGVGTEGVMGDGWDLRNRSISGQSPKITFDEWGISGQSLKQRQGQSERTNIHPIHTSSGCSSKISERRNCRVWTNVSHQTGL